MSIMSNDLTPDEVRYVLSHLLIGIDYCELWVKYGESHRKVKAFREQNASWKTDLDLFQACVSRDVPDAKERFFQKVDEVLADDERFRKR